MRPEPRSPWKSSPARVIIVDDHELARAGMRAMLSGAEELQIVGEASTGREAVALCRRLQPDLALIDLRMPEMDGLVTTRAIKQEAPATNVVIVTLQDNPDYLVEALRAGAAGYVLKDASRHELLSAARRVLRGESILDGELAGRALKRLASAAPAPELAIAEQLTPREREVLQLLAQGQTNREIAHNLTISVGTVKIHVEHIIAKLGVADRTQAAVRAVELKLLGDPFS
ncbi:MAG: DNA-binding response regulator [Chloroflexi bacterium]|nr:MAG: DNA-binding response regulator [Chloroflexota bacterium]